MKIEPGQFWIVDMDGKGGDGHLEYVVTVTPLENGGWACVPIHEGWYDYLSEGDVFLPYGYAPNLSRSMVMTWLAVPLEDDQLIRCFGFLDPDIFEIVKCLWHFRPIPECKQSWIGHKWSVNVPGFHDYCEFQKHQLERWNKFSEKRLNRELALDEEVDPGTVRPST
jgi:hypothetical protein